MHHTLFYLAAAIQASVGQETKEVSSQVGAPYVKITPEMLIQITDKLLLDDIAEVDIDPEAFDVTLPKKRKLRKDPLDEIEFISEVSPRSGAKFSPIR